MKKCPKCGEDKELGLFYNSKGRVDDKSYLCIDCHSIIIVSLEVNMIRLSKVDMLRIKQELKGGDLLLP